MPRSLHEVARVLSFVACAAFAAACSSSDTGSSPPGITGGAPGAGGVTASGGAMASGGVAGTGGVAVPGGTGGTSGAPGAGGAPNVAAGQLMCGGKLCHAGGHCAADGTCPAFLGGCFSGVDKLDSCAAYCSAQGFTCAPKACNTDGTAITDGYSWVSYPAAARAECEKASYPDSNSFDTCASPIWLAPSKPLDDVIRCCCKG